MKYEAAIKVINQGPQEIPPGDKVDQFGKLVAFTKGEADQFEAILGLIERYIEQKAPERPLCIGVFGPPGSGKSFSVKEIVATAVKNANKGDDDKAKIAMPLQTFNLTQIPSPRELSELIIDELSELIGQSIALDGKKVPVLFFDEFDAPLDGSSLGWLSWFLEPMHDGHFQLRGKTIPLRCAVYVFAGGTSSDFRGFSRRSDAEFKNAKGPDFVSRLRGTLDVMGPNERSKRDLRRAVILGKALKDRGAALLGDNPAPSLDISNDLATAFLEAGRFRHGARSIGAMVEMWKVVPKEQGFEPLNKGGLPKENLRENHVDRGPFDPQEIGGGIGLSAGDKRLSSDKEGADAEYRQAWRKVANTLWEQGATLVYGGNADEEGLTALLEKEVSKLPGGLLHKSEAPRPPYLRWVSRSSDADIDSSPREHVQVDPVPKLVKSKRRDLKARIQAATNKKKIRDWLSSSLDMHRLRCQMNDQCVARIVIRGKLSDYSGRFPGILEETLLAIHSGKPVYVIGGFGGAAAVVGELLGIGKTEEMMKDPFEDSEHLAEGLRASGELALEHFSDLFCGEKEKPLPLFFCEAVDLLWKHAIDGPKWVDNGLSRAENKKLCESIDHKEICDLLIQGLERVVK